MGSHPIADFSYSSDVRWLFSILLLFYEEELICINFLLIIRSGIPKPFILNVFFEAYKKTW